MNPSDGDYVRFPNLGTRHLIRGDATGGRFALIEHDIPPRALAAPVHEHEMAPHLSGGGPPDLEAVAAIQAKYGLTMDRESIGPLAERHGLSGR